MSENPEAKQIADKAAILLEIGELYDRALELVDLAYKASCKANQDHKQQEEIFREASRRGRAALSSLKSVTAMVGEALLSAVANAQSKEGSDG